MKELEKLESELKEAHRVLVEHIKSISNGK